MENNYYPVRIGKNSDTIVSDKFPGRLSYTRDQLQGEYEYYGGYLLAESVPSHIAKQIVSAYNEKYAPETGEVFFDENVHGSEGLKRNGQTKELKTELMDKNPFVPSSLDDQIRFIQERLANSGLMEFTRQMYRDILSGLTKLRDQAVKEAPEVVDDKFNINPCVDDDGQDMFKKQITDADLIQTALQEGSITLAESIVLMEHANTPGFKNLFIQMQHINTASKLEYKFNADVIRQRQKELVSGDVAYELHEHSSVFEKFIDKPENVLSIQDAARFMRQAISRGNKLMSCGNGGSYSDAQHFASELSGKYRGIRPAIAAMALSDGGAMSCIANDFGFNHVFERQVEAIGRQGDVLLCLSTSGNSPNVILAAKKARQMGISTIGICGNSCGELKQYLDIRIEIPHSGTADRIQEVTIVIIHILVNLMEKGL